MYQFLSYKGGLLPTQISNYLKFLCLYKLMQVINAPSILYNPHIFLLDIYLEVYRDLQDTF